MISVLSAGFQTTVQDCGRFGFRKLGVTTGGALDVVSLRLANLLVGNPERAAGLELSSGRVRLQFSDERLLAWSGGDFTMRVNDHSIPPRHCASVPTAGLCEISARRGRAWLAVSGGVDVPEVLESRSTDVRARFGGCDGRVLRDDDKLPLGTATAMAQKIKRQLIDGVSNWSAPSLAANTGIIRVLPGKNWEEQAGQSFLAKTFRVALNSDRMGLRLEGEAFASSYPVELVSEPVAVGTVQLPADGAPIVLLADCQTIGGYAKFAHVITLDLARVAQLQPMNDVRFELTSVEDAQELLRERECQIALFRAGLQARFG